MEKKNLLLVVLSAFLLVTGLFGGIVADAATTSNNVARALNIGTTPANSNIGGNATLTVSIARVRQMRADISFCTGARSGNQNNIISQVAGSHAVGTVVNSNRATTNRTSGVTGTGSYWYVRSGGSARITLGTLELSM